MTRSATSSPSPTARLPATWTRDFGFGGLQPQDWQAAWSAHLNTGAGWASPPTTWLTHLSNDPTASTPIYSYDPNGNLTGIDHVPPPRLDP